jgi:large conductance mechanosensitive channel
MDPLRSVRSLDPAKRAFSLVDEFKAFAFKGNVIDLAVGVIIGAAFGKIVDSLVKQIIMPLVSVVLPGKQGYLDWKWVINGKEIPYGLFLGEIVNFVIVALALFLFIVKFLGWLMRTRKEEVAAAHNCSYRKSVVMQSRLLLGGRKSLLDRPFGLIGPERTFHNAAIVQGDHGRGAAGLQLLTRRLRRSWALVLAQPIPVSMGSRAGRKHRRYFVALEPGP